MPGEKQTDREEYKADAHTHAHREPEGFFYVGDVLCPPKLRHKRRRPAYEPEHNHPEKKIWLDTDPYRGQFRFAEASYHNVVHQGKRRTYQALQRDWKRYPSQGFV
jgi:hypothetical protein